MVALSTIQSSNASALKTLFPYGPVGVFVGATNGIGKAALLALAKYATRPRLYFIGRSQSAADEVLRQLKEINPDGQYEFVKADASLLSNVDRICLSIQAKETKIDILFQSQGTLDFASETTEKLPLIMALGYYSKMRFIANLLPLLQRSSNPRVVVVLAGTKEGPVNPKDIPGKKVKIWQARGHLCSMMTLTLERFAQSAPDVSFVHSYPGFVRTSLDQSIRGVTGVIVRSITTITNMFVSRHWIPLDETG
ncbi:Oxidoreductase andH [Penicillium oxalicum]|uniref:Oxidoreductase andH n=1 Tax=Penicillium oxalicum TaxID=69781 RepID=UPI0020B76EF6|nr:Oxidoreductase andH [Penicillium oxalicum]KAI2788731.1 Oxidoreductase andH [Penicillium oxalicum]